MHATTLDQVLTDLRAVTDFAEHRASPIGYFAALYTRMTRAVTRGIHRGFFDDGPQMERLDVAFANLYVDAADRHRRGEGGLCAAWRVAFDAAARPGVTLLQHIYLGMNAHLLVDLPLAVARTCPLEKLPSLRADFLRINAVVDGEMAAFHADLCQASPRLARLQARTGLLWPTSSSAVLRISRRVAWARAARLAGLEGAQQGALIERFDGLAARIGAHIADTKAGFGLALHALLGEEHEDVSKSIRTLRGRDG